MNIKMAVLIGLFVIVFALGYMGWMELYEQMGVPLSVFGALTLAKDLFIESPLWIEFSLYTEIYNVPFKLEFARFVAPLLVLYTVFFVGFTIFKKYFKAYFIRFWLKNYIMIIGYNNDVVSFIKNTENQKIVLITEDINLEITETKNLTIFDDQKEIAKLIMTLKPHKAKKLLLWDKKDEKNLSYLMSLIENTKISKKPKREKIQAYIHLNDYHTYNKVKTIEEDMIFSIHTFNVNNIVASLVVDEYAPDKYINVHDENRIVKIIIIGLDKLGFYIFTEIMQMYVLPNLQKLSITLIDEDIENKKNTILIRFSEICKYVDIKSIEYTTFIEEFDNIVDKDIDIIYACFENQIVNDYIAKKARQLFYGITGKLNTPKIIHIVDEIEKGIMIKKIKEEDDLLGIDYFDKNEAINSAHIIERTEVHEEMAKNIHGYYSHQKGKVLHEDWERLPDYTKEENVYSARHIEYKMRYIDHEIVDISDAREEAKIDNIPKEEYERLGKIEHQRWLIRKILSGYIKGEKLERKIRDTIKIHTDIKDWTELSQEDIEKDYMTLKILRQILESIGKKIVKKRY